MNNQKGFALIWSYLVVLVLTVLLSGFVSATNVEMTHAGIAAAETQAFYLAEAGIDKKLYEINSGNTNSIAATSFANGTYAVTYDTTTKTITSTGTYGGKTRTVTSVVQTGDPTGPPGVKAAVTVPSEIFVVLGMYIDGRDHDANGNLTGQPGTYGIAYGDDPSFDGWILPQIGGNGVAPDQPVPVQARTNLSSDDSADAQSIEAVLGLPAGSTALNTYKTTTAPTVAAGQTGIYYYTPTTAGTEGSPHNINLNGGKGIFIVDNAAHSTNVRFSGSFTGLVVCNNCMFAQYTNILGGVVSVDSHVALFKGPLTVDINKFAQIKYSSDVLQNLPPITGAGYGQSDSTVKYWIDNQNTAGRLTNSP